MGDIPVSMEFDSAWIAPSGVLGDRYEVRRVLGRGGAAIVLLALDRRYEREVAIKVLKPELAGVVATERFLQEVRIAASLQHPHILPLLDSGEGRGFPYYVIPYMAAGSLRDRLDHVRQLPVPEALALTADIAAALAFAHDRGILHRDIKPENILLSGDHAVVADFGLAQALVRAGGDRLTSSGIIVGTPAYISPEQASGDRTLGPPTDVYSLACVLYEMVAGVPPFVGPTAESVIAQRFRGPPHSLRHYRPMVPANLDRAVSRAMCSAPADRFQSAREFAAALGVARGTPPNVTASHGVLERARFTPILARAAIIVAVLAVAALGFRAIEGRSPFGHPLDSSRYVVLPPTGDIGHLTRAASMGHVVAALRRWRDIRVIDDAPPLPDATPTAASDVVRRYDAGRYVTTSIADVGDSVQISAALWATGAAVPAAERTVHLSSDSAQRDDPWQRLLASLLIPDSSRSQEALAPEVPGTSSLAAWRLYSHGRAARAKWDLLQARNDFRAAIETDPRFARAQLWLAQVMAWEQPDHPELWRDGAARAEILSRKLTTADSLLAVALNALGQKQFPVSCAAFRALRALEPDDPVPWFGLGQCQVLDASVVPDRRSPSGWNFRSSWWSAAAAYDSALKRADGAPAFAFSMLSRFLYVDPAWSRWGFGRDSTLFLAYPTLLHDTLAYIPYPRSEIEAGAFRIDRSTVMTAVRKNAIRLKAAFTDWTRRAPRDANAWEALGLAQEADIEGSTTEGGGFSALGSIATAARLTSDSVQRARLAQITVRLLVKSEQFGAANALGDSVLRAIPVADGSQAKALAGIAAVIGRIDRTSDLLRAEARAAPGDVFIGAPPPTPVRDAAVQYLALAAGGDCTGALTAARGALERALQRYATAETRAPMTQATLTRAASLSVACLGPAAVDGLTSADPLVAMQKAAAAGNLDSLRVELRKLDDARRHYRPGDIALDHVYQEAWLLASIGDTLGAVRRLDLSLTALPTLTSHVLEDVPQASALGRAMVLRADIAAKHGDGPTARHWAQGVLALWSGASPVLGKDLARMRSYLTSPR